MFLFIKVYSSHGLQQTHYNNNNNIHETKVLVCILQAQFSHIQLYISTVSTYLSIKWYILCTKIFIKIMGNRFYLLKGKPQEHALQIICPLFSPVQLVIFLKPLLSESLYIIKYGST